MKLQKKITIFMLVGTIVPLLVTMGVSIFYNLRQAQKETVLLARSRLQASANTLSSFFCSRISEIQTYSALPAVQTMNLEAMDHYLQSERKRQAGIYEKFIVGTVDGSFYNTAGGNPYFNNLRTFDDTKPDSKLKSISSRDYWKATVGENFANKRVVFVSDPMISYTTDVKQIVIASSIISKNEVVGMIGGSILWETIEQQINWIRQKISKTYGKNIRFFLISRTGAYWYHWDPDKTVRILKDAAGHPVYNGLGEKAVSTHNILEEGDSALAEIGRAMMQGGTGYGTITLKENELPYFVIYAPVKSASYALAMLVPKSRILEPVIKMRWFFCATISISIVFVVLISLLLARKISKPILRLNTLARAIESGNWQKVNETGVDEISELSRALNTMAESLEKRELELKYSQERFDLAVQGSNDGIWDWKQEDKAYIWCSERMREMLNLDTDKPTPAIHDLRKRIHPEDRKKALAVFLEHLNNDKIYDVEYRIRTGRDTYKWFRFRGKTIKDNMGRPVRMAGSVQDINDLKKSEEEMSLLSTAVEQAEDCILVSDPEGIITYVNPAFEKKSGYTKKEIINKKSKALQSNAHSSAFYRDMWKTMKRGSVWKGHIINKLKDNKLVEFETTISPVKNRSGQISHFVSINRDVSLEKQLEAQLRQAQKMEAIGTLAGGIAHDFNNILSAIFGYAELALQRLPEDSRGNDYIKGILNAAKRAKELVSQILTFSRKSEKAIQPVLIAIVVKEAVKLIRASLPPAIEIKTNLNEQSTVLADASQIHQVLLNLCTNAAHAMKKTGGEIEISLTKTEISDRIASQELGLKKGNYIKLTIKDTGHGIPEEIQEKIFDPFFTTKDLNEGTGLGLSVVHGIVKDHGGAIQLDSQTHIGTCFQIYLPAIEKISSPETASRIALLPQGSEKVLVVDDEATQVEILKIMLEQLSYKVTTMTDSMTALERFRQRPFDYDIVLTDLSMQRMNGDDLAKAIKKIRPDIPILMISGYPDAIEDIAIGMDGIAKLLTKPLLLEDLSKAIRETLDLTKN